MLSFINFFKKNKVQSPLSDCCNYWFFNYFLKKKFQRIYQNIKILQQYGRVSPTPRVPPISVAPCIFGTHKTNVHETAFIMDVSKH